MLYKNPEKPVEERVNDLLSRMTLEEKAAQLKAFLPMAVIDNGKTVSKERLALLAKDGIGRIPQFTTASLVSAKEVARLYNEIQRFMMEETRLGIPFIPQVECLNGLMGADAENFPTALSLAGTFHPELVEKMSSVISAQMKAVGARYGLGPVVDIARDHRWGRVYETYGEDPYLTGVMGVSYVKGMQQGDIKNNVASCAKHFLTYAASDGGLNGGEVSMGPRELVEQYAYPFEAMIRKAGLQGVMCSYTSIDGEPVSVSRRILTGLLRDRLGFEGTAVCDAGSIGRAMEVQGIAMEKAELAAMAVKAGLCADAPMTNTFHAIPEAIQKGYLTEEELDVQVKLVLKQKFALGLFDAPYVDLDHVEKVYACPENGDLNRKICEETITLLKNEGNLLPLTKRPQKIAVIGPHGDRVSALFGGYTFAQALEMFSMQDMRRASMQGVADKLGKDQAVEDILLAKAGPSRHAKVRQELKELGLQETAAREYYHGVSLAEALRNKKIGEVVCCRGCGVTGPLDQEEVARAVRAAAEADVVVFAMGDKCGWSADATSGEGKDRMSLDLPGSQEELMKRVLEVNQKAVLILFNGRPLALNYPSSQVPAIIEAWLPGPKGGEVLADILYGDVNPSGRLPVTLARSAAQTPVYYCHKTGSGYKDNRGELESIFGGEYTDGTTHPLYYFGQGLSYTTYSIHSLRLEKDQWSPGEEIRLRCKVKNTGSRAGMETVQIYFAVRGLRVTRPVRQLAAFQKVELAPGEEKELAFMIPGEKAGFIDWDGKLYLEPCNLRVEAAYSSYEIAESCETRILGEAKVLDHAEEFISRCVIA